MMLSISKVDIYIGAVNFDFGCIETDLFSQQLYVLVVYRPRSTNINDFLEEFSIFLDKCTTTFPCDALLTTAGDFNINLFVDDTIVKNFLSEMHCHNLYPTIFKTIRLTNSSSTLIDNIFTNISFLAYSGIFVTNISDHFPIIASFTLTETNTCNNFILR